MDFNVEAAKKSGYSDSEIASYLAKDANFDIEGAKKSGYSDPEIIQHLVNDQAAQKAPKATNTQFQQDILFPPSTYQRGVNALVHVPGDLISLPGTLVDLTAGAANTLGQSAANLIGQPQLAGPLLPTNLGQTIRAPIDAMTGAREMVRPTNALDQWVETGARLGGNMIVPSGGVIAKAEKPVKAALAELLSGAGMTVGTEAGGELGKQAGNEGLGRMIGGGIGGFYPSVAPTRLILGSKPVQKLGEKVVDYFRSPSDRINLANTVVGEDLRRYLGESPEYAANIKAAQNIGIPGFEPNLAQASGASAIQNLTTSLETHDPVFQAANINAYKANKQKIVDFENTIFPKTEISPKQSATDALQAQRQQISSRLADVNQQMDTLASQYQRQPTDQIGARLRELRNEQMALVRKTKDENYAEVSKAANASGAVTSRDDLVKTVQDIIKAEPNRFQGPNMPGVFGQILNFGKKENPSHAPLEELRIPTSAESVVNPTQGAGKTMTFDELLSLRQRVNQEWNSARAGTDTTRTYFIGKLKDQINQKMEAFKDPQYGDLAAKLTNADKFYNEAYRIPFREGAGGRMPYSNRFGEVTPDEQVVSKLLFTPGTKKGVEDFYSMYGDHPEANSLLRKGILDEFAASVVKEGKSGNLEINPKSVENFFNKYHETFSDPRLADVKAQLSSTENAAKLLQQRRIQILQDKKDLATSTLAKIYKVENPNYLMDKAINSPSIMETLVNTAKTPEHKQALSYGIAEAIKRQPDPFQFMLDNQKTLQPVLDRINPGHFNNLKTIAYGSQILDRAKPTANVNIGKMKDPIEEALGTSGVSLLSRIRNIKLYGRISETYFISDLAMKKLLQLGQEQRIQVMKSALNDPKLAADLSAAMKGSKSPELKNRISNHLVSLGIRSVGSQDNYPSQPIKEGTQIDPSFFQGQ